MMNAISKLGGFSIISGISKNEKPYLRLQYSHKNADGEWTDEGFFIYKENISVLQAVLADATTKIIAIETNIANERMQNYANSEKGKKSQEEDAPF